MSTPGQNAKERRGSLNQEGRNRRSGEVGDGVVGRHHSRNHRSLSPRSKSIRRRSQQNELRIELLRRQAIIPFNTADYLTRWLRVSQTSLCQQKLWEVSPVFNYRLVGRILLVMAMVVGPLGAYLVLSGNSSKDFKINYGEECKSEQNYLRLLRKSCVFCRGGYNPSCDKMWVLKENLRTPVYVYYELDDIVQNHRALVSSYDLKQITGRLFDNKTMQAFEPDITCSPLRRDSQGMIYFPCGAIANMMFNDDFSMKTENNVEVKLRKKGIAHSMLKNYKYKNPEEVNKKNYNYKKIFVNNFTKPKDWSKDFWDEWWKNGGMQNEAFINWMVTSAKSTIRKLYAVIDSVPDCHPGVFCKGNYTIHIDYRFDSHGFGGTKSLVFSTISKTGTRNRFTGYFAVLLGVVQASLGFYFLQVYDLNIRKRKKSSLPLFSKDSSSSSSSSSRSSSERLQPCPPPADPPPPIEEEAQEEEEGEIRQLFPIKESKEKADEIEVKPVETNQAVDETEVNNEDNQLKDEVKAEESDQPANEGESAHVPQKKKVVWKLSESTGEPKVEEFKFVYPYGSNQRSDSVDAWSDGRNRSLDAISTTSDIDSSNVPPPAPPPSAVTVVDDEKPGPSSASYTIIR